MSDTRHFSSVIKLSLFHLDASNYNIIDKIKWVNYTTRHTLLVEIIPQNHEIGIKTGSNLEVGDQGQ